MHIKISECIKNMLIGTKNSLPFYGEFALELNIIKSDTISTCGVNLTNSGMNLYYNEKFLDNLSQKEVNFIIIHEIYHLLFNHHKRVTLSNFNFKLSNYAQDMIINYLIYKQIKYDFVEIPKKDGMNMALFPPFVYKGKLIYEDLYLYLENKADKFNSLDHNPMYGEFGIDKLETYNLDKLLSDDDNYLDEHLDDDISDELRELYISDLINRVTERLENRGITTSEITKVLGELRTTKIDHLKDIKNIISNEICGDKKVKSISRPNRRGIAGLKGRKKYKTIINVILDVSGSMKNEFEYVLSYIYQNNIEINMIQSDVKVNLVLEKLNKNAISKMKISGLGGTLLQPAVNYVVNNYNKYNTCILTDGKCDSLDLSGLKGRCLILTTSDKVIIKRGNAKQIII